MDARDWMLEHGHSRESLSQITRVTRTTVNRWIRENVIPWPVRRMIELQHTTDVLWTGWRIRGDTIYTANGNSATRHQIEALPLTRETLRIIQQENAALKAAPVQYLIDFK